MSSYIIIQPLKVKQRNYIWGLLSFWEAKLEKSCCVNLDFLVQIKPLEVEELQLAQIDKGKICYTTLTDVYELHFINKKIVYVSAKYNENLLNRVNNYWPGEEGDKFRLFNRNR